MTGLPINGVLVPLAGLTIVPPYAIDGVRMGGPEWCQLSPEDYRMRPAGSLVGIVAPHSTSGNWPQPVIAGAGPGGHAREILEMWRRDPRSSAAHAVVDLDGTVYCAADFQLHEAYHAQAINPRSIGIEMCTRPDGGIHQATLTATVDLIAALTCSGRQGSGLFPIPFQHRAGPYNGQPLRRLQVGGVQSEGRDVCGVIGHRDQTGARGQGDPGDELMLELQLAGSEAVDYDGGQDLELARQRQRRLNELTAATHPGNQLLAIDGICGPASIAAMRLHGYLRWRDVV